MTDAKSSPPAGDGGENFVVRWLHTVGLRARVLLILVLMLGLSLLMTIALASVLLRMFLVEQMDRDLKAQAVPIYTATVEPAGPQGSAGYKPPSSYVVMLQGVRNRVQVPVSSPAVEAASVPAFPILTPESREVSTGEPFTLTAPDGSRWRGVAGLTSSRAAIVTVALPLEPLERTLSELTTLSLQVALFVILITAAMGWLAVRRALRPLSEIEDTAAAIAAGDLSRRIRIRYAGDEVSSLSLSLNAMLTDIEASFASRRASEERMRRFVADASHELRTPLASIRGYAELYRQGAVTAPDDVAQAMRRIEDEARRLGGIVEDLLTLTRMDSSAPEPRQPVDLTVLVADAVADARARDKDRPVRLLGLRGDVQPTLALGYEARLRQVLANLLGNAAMHTPPGTPVEVKVGYDGDKAVVEVVDHGRGIDEKERARLFERFYRADPGRARHTGGTGLGLAIVAAIISAHSGRVTVESTPGGGATFRVEIPRSTGLSQASSRGG